MSRILAAVLPFFCAVLLLGSGLLTLFGSVFTLGSQEDLVRQHQVAGFFPSLALRLLVVGLFGLVLALATAAISLLFRRWHRPGSWAGPKPLLWRAVAVNLLCALVGCAWFTWSNMP
ncbi:hypothetical protein I2I05_11750 [Hymenobacter sp. BT683]|uniref:Uncharacterized protein n=1 Tax=Hymenobacter jeongseonensis TaxID=2791027 RepID=A0ABS0IJ75_9BACT|nr:hypothetical protein [Hymenobacter jeongseonensis]MBF9238069.1 hypothetical protein [Hymenobacter jeongseonensis]